MHDTSYTFKGKDITKNVFIQIYAALEIIQERMKIDFKDVVNQFYSSETYKLLNNMENPLWAESATYIADRFFEEKENAEKNPFIKLQETEEYVEKEVWDKLLEAKEEVDIMREEAREKAIRDYNSQMNSAMRRGMEKGIAIGEKRAEERMKRIFKLSAQGKSAEEIAEECGVTMEKVLDILN